MLPRRRADCARGRGTAIPVGVSRDYTTCNASQQGGTAYITASAGGRVQQSNTLIYIHPIVTSVALGGCLHGQFKRSGDELQSCVHELDRAGRQLYRRVSYVGDLSLESCVGEQLLHGSSEHGVWHRSGNLSCRELSLAGNDRPAGSACVRGYGDSPAECQLPGRAPVLVHPRTRT